MDHTGDVAFAGFGVGEGEIAVGEGETSAAGTGEGGVGNVIRAVGAVLDEGVDHDNLLMVGRGSVVTGLGGGVGGGQVGDDGKGGIGDAVGEGEQFGSEGGLVAALFDDRVIAGRGKSG